MRVQLVHSFEKITSTENLLEAWREFLKGKRRKNDVQKFSLHLMDNILTLRNEVVNGVYTHGGYEAFNISDPKPRNIHKASVRDRLMHHAICRVLIPFFNKTFIADSFSCQVGKGTHAALQRFRYFTHKASKNNTKTCWILKCDIRKFFASINHVILLGTLRKYLPDERTMELLEKIIGSFHSTESGTGLPLGNLTSQLFVNVYMNELDQFVKHKLRMKYYLRYADDFAFLSEDKVELESILPQVKEFLEKKLKLTLHPYKVFIKTLASGVDFLGWVHFPTHSVLRTTTKKRMFKRSMKHPTRNTIAAYQGFLSHGNAKKLGARLPDPQGR